MPEQTIDTLQIEIKGDAKSGYDALDNIIKRLEKLEKISNKVSKTENKLDSVSKKASGGFGKFASSLRKVERVLNVVTDKCAEWFNESNSYTEALNLFEVTMGKGADAAKEYADKLQNLMGIDVKEWMNYQGSFNQLLTGYGMDESVSNQMSQQLTQIAYDLSSLWNTDVQTAFQKVQSGMSGQIKGLKVWGINLSVAQLKETALAHGIELSTSKMTEAQKATLRYITIMEKTQNVQGDLARTIITPANAMRILNAQITQMKRALGNIVSVLVVKFIPVLQVVVNWLTVAAQRVADLLGFQLPEIDYSGLDMSSSFADDLAEGLDESNDEAKKLKKTLMGFDELNVLNAPKDTTSTLLGGGLPADLGLDLSKYGYDFTEGLKSIDTAQIESTLKKIEIIASGFLLALGVILVLTGHLPIGIALIIAGVAGLVAAVAINWGSLDKSVISTLTTITAVLGGFLLAIGAILAFSGASLPLGIALMVLGAVSLATALTLNWKFAEDKVGGTLGIIASIVSGAALALGILFIITGVSIPLGIAFLVVGAIGLVSQLALNWNAASDKVKEVIATITTIVSVAFIAIGALLAFSGIQIALGIAMLAIGAFTLISAGKEQWDLIPQDIREVIVKVGMIVGVALLVLGAILAFSGVGVPLGIGMMVAGAATLAATAALDWEFMKNKITEVIKKIGAIVGAALLVLGAILVFTGVGIPLGIALMVAGVALIITAAVLNWDTVKQKIKSVLASILSIISAAAIAIGIILCLTGAGIGLGIAMIMLGLKGVQKAEKVDSNPITKWIKSVCNGAIDLVERAINKCIGLINKFSFSWDVPDWMQDVLGFDTVKLGFDLDTVSIPRLATGGMISAGQAFIARESGPELVASAGGGRTAVMNNDQIVDSVSNGVYRAMREAMSDSSGQGGSVINLTVTLDGEPIYKDTVKRHNDEVKATGSSPLLVGG